GGDPVHPLLRAQRLRADARLQRRIRGALSRRRAPLAATPPLRWLGRARHRHPRRRRAAGGRAGESAAFADTRAPRLSGIARAHTTTLPSVARRFQSAAAERLVVEEGLR